MLQKAFFDAGKKPECWSANDLIAAIKRERPDLEDAVFLSPGQGGQAHTFILENEVIKGAKFSAQIPGFITECETLRALQGKGLPVPAVTCVGEESAFYGMQRISGVVASSVFSGLDDSQKQHLAHDIAQFITDMHAALPYPVQESALDRINKGFRDTVMEGLRHPGMRQVLGAHAEEAITEYLERREDVTRALHLHMDIQGGNILLDPDTKRLNGFVDFGYMADRPPEDALDPVAKSFGPDFAGKVWGEYVALNKDRNAADFKCRGLCQAVMEASLYKEQEIPQHLAASIKEKLTAFERHRTAGRVTDAKMKGISS